MSGKQFKVAFHGTYGYDMPKVLVDAIKATPSLVGFVDSARFRPCESVPRHHPDFVKIVEAHPETDWEIEVLDGPMYTITEYDGKERVVALADLTRNAAEFDKVV